MTWSILTVAVSVRFVWLLSVTITIFQGFRDIMIKSTLRQASVNMHIGSIL
ncbi:hypothetical protein V7266_28695 [Neobacillus drentensis]|uniref:hypothetical protein n=1 Tax=Neobacillus drentensis TaxID=220684 RepID=UPI00300004E5